MSTYSFEATKLNVGGLDITGYGESMGIALAWETDALVPSTGIDGEVTYSLISNKNALMTVTVMNTSKGYRDLAALQRAQETQVKAGISLNIMTVMYVDPFIGDTITSAKGRLLNRPNLSKGAVAGEVEFRIHIANPIRTNGALIVG